MSLIGTRAADAKTRWSDMARFGLRRLFQLRLGVLGAFLLILLVVSAVFAPYIATHDPYAQTITQRLVPPVFLDGGSWAHILGTDQLGRDLFSRIVYGARVSLIVGIGAVCLSTVIGVSLGILAGYFGGLLDTVISFVINVMLGFPFILLALSLVAVLGPSLVNIIIALGLTSWPVFARVTRIETMKLRDREFVLAAMSQGLGPIRILHRHVLSNLMAPILVIMTVEIARAIIRESLLSFLGLGVQPPIPSWGSMLAEGRNYILVVWWLTTLPGVAIFLSALGINLVGDALRDLTDPRMRRS